MTRTLAALMCLLSSTACATADGRTFQAIPHTLQMEQSEIVIYRNPGSLAPGPTLSIDNVERCKIASGGYTTIKVAPNSTVRLKLRRFGDISSSEVTLNTLPGKRQYYRVTFNTGGMFAYAATGLIGGTIIDQRGTFLFEDGNEQEASGTREDLSCIR